MKTIIIIPAHNEERTVGSIVKNARKYGTVIVINDASSDGTAAAASRADAKVITHKVNKGLGAALRTGFAAALQSSAGIVITLDADGQHDPDDIPKFIEKIEKGYDFVLGERNLYRYPFIKKFGNFFLNTMTNFISGTSLKDTESGFR